MSHNCCIHEEHTKHYEQKFIMNRIKELLKEKGIKQKWLTEKLGKSYNMVNAYVQNS